MSQVASNQIQISISNNAQDTVPVSLEKVELNRNYSFYIKGPLIIIVKEGQNAKVNDNKGHYTFILFVNSGSGDSKAALLTKLDVIL